VIGQGIETRTGCPQVGAAGELVGALGELGGGRLHDGGGGWGMRHGSGGGYYAGDGQLGDRSNQVKGTILRYSMRFRTRQLRAVRLNGGRPSFSDADQGVSGFARSNKTQEKSG
jgi:hypothetical protein